MTIIVGAYIRVSTSKQKKKGASLEAQETLLNKYASDNGITIDKWYVDGGKSAGKQNRNDYKRMLDDIKSNNLNHILTLENERFIRGTTDRNVITELMRKYKLKITMIDGKFHYGSAGEEFIGTVVAAKGKLELDQDRERTIRCMVELAEQGFFPHGHNPIGFKKIRVGEKERIKLLLDEGYTSEILQMYKDVQTNKWTFHQAYLVASSRNFLGRKWNRGTFSRFMKNKLNKGTYYICYDMWYYIQELDLPEFVDAHVPEELFDDVNKILSRRIKEHSYSYIFDRLVYCHACEEYAVNSCTIKRLKKTRQRKVYKYYQCQSCGKRINENVIFENAKDLLNEHMLSPENKGVEMDIKDRIQRTEIVLSRLGKAFLNGSISLDYYEQENMTLMKSLNKLNREYHKKTGVENINTSIRSRSYIQKNINRLVVNFYFKSIVDIEWK